MNTFHANILFVTFYLDQFSKSIVTIFHFITAKKKKRKKKVTRLKTFAILQVKMESSFILFIY